MPTRPEASALGMVWRHAARGSVMKNRMGTSACRRSRSLPRTCLLLCALAAAPALAQQVSDSYDRGRGERTIGYTADGSRDMRRPVFSFEANFVDSTSSSVVTLAFVSAGDGSNVPRARFSGCHDIGWYVDGQPLAASAASHRASVIDGELIELLEQDVSAGWVDAIAVARDVRYRVCRDEYALTSNDIAAFARVAAKLKSALQATYSPGNAAPARAAAAGEVGYEGMRWRPSSKASPFR